MRVVEISAGVELGLEGKDSFEAGEFMEVTVACDEAIQDSCVGEGEGRRRKGR